MLSEFFNDKGRRASLLTRIGRVVLVLMVGGVFLAVGIEQLNHDSKPWRKARCRILSSLVRSDNSASGREFPYHVEVGFQYKSGPGSRTATEEPCDPTDDAATAYEVSGRYVPGSESDCFFDASEPSTATLQQPSPAASRWFLVGAIALELGIIIYYAIPQLFFYRPRLKGAKNPNSRRLVNFSLSTVVLAAGGAGCISWYILPLVEVIQSSRWQPQQAKIVASGIIERTERGENSYTAYRSDILFTYQIGNQICYSNCFNPTEGSTIFGSLRRQFCESFPAGKVVTCYVDPAHPWHATLSRHVSPGILTGVWCAVLAVAGAAGVWNRGRELPMRAVYRRRPMFVTTVILMVGLFALGQIMTP